MGKINLSGYNTITLPCTNSEFEEWVKFIGAFQKLPTDKQEFIRNEVFAAEGDKYMNELAKTSTDRNNLMNLLDDIGDVEKLISKCTAAADMFEDALRYSESRPTDMDIYPDMAKVISEYGYKAKAAVKQLEKDFGKFRNEIMDKKEG